MWYPRSLLADTGLEKLKRTEWICQPLSDCQIVVMHLQSQENKVNSPNLWTIPQRIPCAWAKEVKVFGASVTLLHSCLPPFSVQFSWSATDPEFPPSLLLVDKWRYKSYPPLWGWSQQYHGEQKQQRLWKETDLSSSSDFAIDQIWDLRHVASLLHL